MSLHCLALFDTEYTLFSAARAGGQAVMGQPHQTTVKQSRRNYRLLPEKRGNRCWIGRGNSVPIRAGMK